MGYNILHPVEGFSRAPYPFYPWLLRPLRSRSYPVSSGQYNFFFFIDMEKRNGSRWQRKKEADCSLALSQLISATIIRKYYFCIIDRGPWHLVNKFRDNGLSLAKTNRARGIELRFPKISGKIRTKTSASAWEKISVAILLGVIVIERNKKTT